MSASQPRVVISGVGVVSPIGTGREAYWESLQNGRSGVRRIEAFDTAGLPIHIGGEVLEFNAKQYLDKKERKSLKVMARPIQMAVAATALALEDGMIDKNEIDPTRFGVEFGAGLIASELDELGAPAQTSSNGQPKHMDLTKWGVDGLAAMPPLWMLKYLPNMPACHVSILHNLQGPNNTITENDVAPLLAMGEAYRILQRDMADIMLTGAADSKMNPLSMTRQSLFMTLSGRSHEPEKACRPFDKDRDGIVPGEGAGVLVMESWDHARKRGVPIHAEVVGFGSAFDRILDGSGLARAIQAALRDAGIEPNDIDHINAQGFSTVKEDAWEAKGIYLVFGGPESGPPVFAGKSYFGSLGAASGAVESIASILALNSGSLPPTLNYESADTDCPVSVLAGQPRELEKDHFLKISFTNMGQCAAMVFRKWAE